MGRNRRSFYVSGGFFVVSAFLTSIARAGEPASHFETGIIDESTGQPLVAVPIEIQSLSEPAVDETAADGRPSYEHTVMVRRLDPTKLGGPRFPKPFATYHPQLPSTITLDVFTRPSNSVASLSTPNHRGDDCDTPVSPLPFHEGWLKTGIHISNPQILSYSVGVVLFAKPRPPECGNVEKRDPKNDNEDPDDEVLRLLGLPQGVLLTLEPGLGGARASLGYVGSIKLGHATIKGIRLPIMLNLRGSYLRTYGLSLWTPKDQSYVGPGFDIGLANLLNLQFDVMRRISGDTHDHRWLMSAGIGINNTRLLWTVIKKLFS